MISQEPLVQAPAYQWVLLSNSPVASSRTDDIWFFDELTGWLVNSSGYVCKTVDGGNNWEPRFFLAPNLPSLPYLRCMSWANRQFGWFGAVTGVGGSTLDSLKYPSQYIRTLLHHTTDGGETWKPVMNLPEDSPAGICGFHAVNERVAYGSGTNDPGLPGPAIIKTTNGGASWELIPMQEYANNLIDIYFFDENNGFVVGGKNTDACPASTKEDPVDGYPVPRLSRYARLKPVVLRTDNGGKTWTDTAAGTRGLPFPCGEWGWKIQFLNDNPRVGFVALENFVNAAILTTTDGGASWTRKQVAANQDPNSKPINNDLEGIGFINEKQGWVGGWGFPVGGDDFVGLQNSYTEDGGETWVPQDNVPNDPASDPRIRINRYRLLGNPVTGGYCSGQQVYQLQIGGKKSAFGKKTAFGAQAVVQPLAGRVEPTHGLSLSYSALGDGLVKITYTLPEDAKNVFLGLWNKFAFHMRTLVSEKVQAAGRWSVIWDGLDAEGRPARDGVYICRMCTDGERGASQMIHWQGAF